MSRKHEKTLAAIFSDPAPANIAWRDVVALLASLGAEIAQARGSRIHVVLGEATAVFHEPHPEKEASRPMVRSVRVFLLRAGAVEAEGEAEQGE
jgi:hypothetical protein